MIILIIYFHLNKILILHAFNFLTISCKLNCIFLLTCSSNIILMDCFYLEEKFCVQLRLFLVLLFIYYLYYLFIMYILLFIKNIQYFFCFEILFPFPVCAVPWECWFSVTSQNHM